MSYKKWLLNRDPYYKIYSLYKKSANKRDILFDIDYQLFIEYMNKSCYYCGSNAIGMDRVNNKIGYIQDNVVSCCRKCNMMKYTHSVEDFLSHISKIYHHNTKV